MTQPLPYDRHYLSRYAIETVGFTAMVGGIAGDVDGNTVAATMVNPTTGVTLWSRSAQHLAVGQYGEQLSSVDTQTPALLDLHFTFTVGGTSGIYVVELQVGPSAPDYDPLDPHWKTLVEHVWTRFADLYDSPYGGPYLETQLQTRFGRNRLAQLLRQAVGRLNTIGQPNYTYSVDNASFPFAQWGPLAEQALYVETLKHFVRTYVEQPEVVLATSASRLDRRDYMSRWSELLQIEQADLEFQYEAFKMANLGLGNVNALISGGAYGRLGPWASAGSVGQAAARGYFPLVYLGGY